jgi:hypothetical protein
MQLGDGIFVKLIAMGFATVSLRERLAQIERFGMRIG